MGHSYYKADTREGEDMGRFMNSYEIYEFWGRRGYFYRLYFFVRR